MTIANGRWADGRACGECAGGAAELVRRDGPLIYGVCRRILPSRDKAAEAFQAACLGLAREDGSLRRRKAREVRAYHIALRAARKARSRRQMPAASRRSRRARVYTVDSAWEDVCPVLDAELGRLPARYRDVIVLCDLSARPREEAAAALGMSLEAVGLCLSQAREALRARLARRGIALSAGLTAVLLTERAAPPVPGELVAAAIEAAAALPPHAPAAAKSAHAAAGRQGAASRVEPARAKVVLAVIAVLIAATAGTCLAVLQAVLR
jgi:RNA polymerase sigma factor (sigma-70 family)